MHIAYRLPKKSDDLDPLALATEIGKVFGVDAVAVLRAEKQIGYIAGDTTDTSNKAHFTRKIIPQLTLAYSDRKSQQPKPAEAADQDYGNSEKTKPGKPAETVSQGRAHNGKLKSNKPNKARDQGPAELKRKLNNYVYIKPRERTPVERIPRLTIDDNARMSGFARIQDNPEWAVAFQQSSLDRRFAEVTRLPIISRELCLERVHLWRYLTTSGDEPKGISSRTAATIKHAIDILATGETTLPAQPRAPERPVSANGSQATPSQTTVKPARPAVA